jgi:hypothetical protein
MPLQLLSIDQLHELLEKITGVVWAGRGFGMILHAENRKLFVAHSLDCAVIEIDVCDFDLFWQRFGIDCKPMILRGDCHFARSQIFDRLISTAMAKFKFESPTPIGKAKHLMSQTNAKNRFTADQAVHALVGIRQSFGIARPIG